MGYLFCQGATELEWMDEDRREKSEKAVFFSVTGITTIPPQRWMELCYFQSFLLFSFYILFSFDYLNNLQKQEEEADGQK